MFYIDLVYDLCNKKPFRRRHSNFEGKREHLAEITKELWSEATTHMTTPKKVNRSDTPRLPPNAKPPKKFKTEKSIYSNIYNNTKMQTQHGKYLKFIFSPPSPPVVHLLQLLQPQLR